MGRQPARIATAALVVSLARLAKRRNTSLAAVGLVSGLFTTASAGDRYIGSMLTYLRYALAIACFAASVSCLALWWRSSAYRVLFITPNFGSPNSYIAIETWVGFTFMAVVEERQPIWMYGENKLKPAQIQDARKTMGRPSQFWKNDFACRFPLWYPTLLFALASVAALRLGRRFTIRSAVIATAVAALLLGMAVAL